MRPPAARPCAAVGDGPNHQPRVVTVGGSSRSQRGGACPDRTMRKHHNERAPICDRLCSRSEPLQPAIPPVATTRAANNQARTMRGSGVRIQCNIHGPTRPRTRSRTAASRTPPRIGATTMAGSARWGGRSVHRLVSDQARPRGRDTRRRARRAAGRGARRSRSDRRRRRASGPDGAPLRLWDPSSPRTKTGAASARRALLDVSNSEGRSRLSQSAVTGLFVQKTGLGARQFG